MSTTFTGPTQTLQVMAQGSVTECLMKLVSIVKECKENHKKSQK